MPRGETAAVRGPVLAIVASMLPGVSAGQAPAAAATDADLPQALRHNPFDRPRALARPRAVPAQVTPPAPPLEVRGVLLAGEGSLANVDGEIVAPGERVGEHELVRVQEDGAVFRHQGQEILIKLSEPSPDDELASLSGDD